MNRPSLKILENRRIICACVRFQYSAAVDTNINLSESGKTRFEEDYQNAHVEANLFQKTLLSCGSAALSLINPRRADMISVLGETTGNCALKYVRDKMLKSSEGKKILEDMPRINSRTVNLEKLSCLPEGTLGKTYSNFLINNNVTPDSRMTVQFVDDIDLAYVIQRYRESHDLFHTILNMPTNMLGEVTVKWVEAIQTRLPMCIGGAVFGAMRLAPKQRLNYVQHYLPWAIQTGKNSEFLMNIYFENRWEQNISDIHREFNIQPLSIK